MTAEIRALQVDNQFDGGTPFPVVLSIEPSSGPAMSLQVLQTFDDEEQGSHRFYDMISLEVGEGMPSPRACSASRANIFDHHTCWCHVPTVGQQMTRRMLNQQGLCLWRICS